jgi:hypothetical protein
VTPGEEQDLRRAHARAVMVAETSARDVDRLRALVEQHEERARVHTEERAAHYGEMARVQRLIDDVVHAHERDLLAIWSALGETHEPPENVAAIVEAITAHIADADDLAVTLKGRDTAPTDDEIAAHREAEAGWLVAVPHVYGPADVYFVGHSEARDGGAPDGATWWPLDYDGRPCAWPVVEVSHG